MERLAAALLISGELTKRLSKLNDYEIGVLLDDEVGARLNILAPELTICLAAADRLRRRPIFLTESNRLGPRQKQKSSYAAVPGPTQLGVWGATEQKTGLVNCG